MTSNKAHYDILETAKGEIKPPIEPNKFRVFVFGPRLEPNVEVDKPENPAVNPNDVNQHARYLRFATKRALESLGFTVDFGESKDPYRFWHFCYKGSDHASYELYQARWQCGAIVVFPSSEGSVCEISLISLNNKIAKKTIAIIHEPYRHHESFFQKAVLELYWHENGTREYLDYGDHDACIEFAVKYVRGKFTKFLRDYQSLEDSQEWAKDYAQIIGQ